MGAGGGPRGPGGHPGYPAAAWQEGRCVPMYCGGFWVKTRGVLQLGAPLREGRDIHLAGVQVSHRGGCTMGDSTC